MRTLIPEGEGAGKQANMKAAASGTQEEKKPATELAVEPTTEGWLSELAEPTQETVCSSGGKFAYPGFASKRAATWEALQQLHPGVKEGDAFVGFEDGQLEVLGQFKLFLVRFKQMWTQRDDNYGLEEVVFTDPGRKAGFTEEFLTLCIVITPNQLVPVVGFFGGTKAGALRNGAQALLKASTPDWLRTSPAHAASAKCRLPFGRFTVSVTTKPLVSKSTGHPYQLAVGQVTPATLEEIAALEQALRDRDFCDRFKEGLEVFQARLEILKTMAVAAAA
jgi:hypothetical protein